MPYRVSNSTDLSEKCPWVKGSQLQAGGQGNPRTKADSTFHDAPPHCRFALIRVTSAGRLAAYLPKLTGNLLWQDLVIPGTGRADPSRNPEVGVHVQIPVLLGKEVPPL